MNDRRAGNAIAAASIRDLLKNEQWPIAFRIEVLSGILDRKCTEKDLREYLNQIPTS